MHLHKRSPLQKLLDNRMIWIPEFGIGWYPVTADPYGSRYWHEYRHRDNTDIGAGLTRDRINWVRQHYAGSVCDIGIGGGRFVDDAGSAGYDITGYDINPVAVQWLLAKNKYLDATEASIDAATFWDSLEHIPDPSFLLKNVKYWTFLSIPIFRDSAHALTSKHYKPDEHCWYFTTDGLMHFMKMHGFGCIGQCKMEQDLGREDIGTFAFRRESDVQ